MSGVQLLGLAGGFAILYALFEMLRRRMLRERFAVIWTVVALGAVTVGLVPDTLTWASHLLGLQVPSNLLFFVASIALLGISLQHSYELGRSDDHARSLAEEVALLRLRLDEVEARLSADQEQVSRQ